MSNALARSGATAFGQARSAARDQVVVALAQAGGVDAEGEARRDERAVACGDVGGPRVAEHVRGRQQARPLRRGAVGDARDLLAQALRRLRVRGGGQREREEGEGEEQAAHPAR